MKKISKNNILLILIFLTTSILGIGYASISEVDLNVNGIASLEEQNGIYITNVQYLSNNNANPENSNINTWYQTGLNTKTVLNNASDSTITYEITIINEYLVPYEFEDVKYLNDLYDNEDITFVLNGLSPGDELYPNETVTFTITFKYKDMKDSYSNTELNSYLNFKFVPLHTITYVNIDTEGKNYPEYIGNGKTLNVTFIDDVPEEIMISETNNYSYNISSGNLIVNNVTTDLTISKVNAKITITYLSNNGYFGTVTSDTTNEVVYAWDGTKNVDIFSTYKEPVRPICGTYFVGWYTTSNTQEGTEFTLDQRLTENQTVYAKYKTPNPTIPVTGTAADDIRALYLNGNTDLLIDTTCDKNIRYVGATPNNYIYFNNELWRILGVYNNVNDTTGKFESRLKIIRDGSVGNLSYDSSSPNDPDDVNPGDNKGFNDWTKSDMMHTLNAGYDNNTVEKQRGSVYTTIIANNSLWWNRAAGECTFSQSNDVTECDFTSTGLLNAYKSYIGDARWNIAANNGINGNALSIYNNEHGTVTRNGKRPIYWDGKVALPHISDYAFATSDTSCYSKNVKDWGSSANCINTNWMATEEEFWTLTPHQNNHHYMLYIDGDGVLKDSNAVSRRNIYPTLFLRSDVKFSGGSGTIDDPYILS